MTGRFSPSKKGLFDMSHEIESVNGKACMAYSGETPWHGLGTKVPADLTPHQMLEAAGLDWKVEKVEAFASINKKRVPVGRSALVRIPGHKILDVVGNDWNPVQNERAFEFFNDFIAAGDMEMHTAGSLRGGQIVWALAKVKDSFELFGGDRVESYLLFSNFHKYGFSTDVRFTPIRVVCNNTLTLSLSAKSEHVVRVPHRSEFDPEEVKDVLGIARTKLDKYREMATFLGSKKAKDEDIVQYFTRVFPVTSSGSKKEISANAKAALEALLNQPGTEYAPGTWWQAFNASTYLIDHSLGRTDDSRLTASWYGFNRGVKTKALELACEMATAS